LNIKVYKKLCLICDKILGINPNIYRVSIPLLHVLKEHPHLLDKYYFVKNDKITKSLIRNTSHKKSFVRNFFLHKEIPHKINKNYDIIFFTHLVNIDHLNQEFDFYLSDFPVYLSTKKMNVLVVFLNQTKHSSSDLQKLVQNDKVDKLVIPEFLNLKNEFMIYFGYLIELVKNRLLSLLKTGMERDAYRFFSTIEGTRGTVFALRAAFFLRGLLGKYTPKIVFTVYEGHSWERVIYKVAHDKSIQCIAYQHSVITENAHAIGRPLFNNYDPDLILTSGKITKSILETKDISKYSSIKEFGSSKLRNIKKPISQKKNYLKKILVIPEGLMDECEKLLKFSYYSAFVMDEYEFIWRFHPHLDPDVVMKEIGIQRSKLPKNIIISSNSLEKDIEESSFALYRGSTAITDCVLGNVLPVYYNSGESLTIDLFFQKNDLHPEVSNIDDLCKVVSNYAVNYDFETLKGYCNKYFSKPDYEKAFLDMELIERQ